MSVIACFQNVSWLGVSTRRMCAIAWINVMCVAEDAGNDDDLRIRG